VLLVPNKVNSKKVRRKGKEWIISICAVIFLLLSGICFTPFSCKLDTCNSIHIPGLKGAPYQALQNRLTGPVALHKALRSTGSFSHIVHAATISVNDLSPRSLPRIFELDHSGSPNSKFVRSTIKVRAPPLRLSAIIL
jgi:hypothetical protein